MIETDEEINMEYITKVIRLKTVPMVLELVDEDSYSPVGQAYGTLRTIVNSKDQESRKFSLFEEANLKDFNRFKEAIRNTREGI